MNNLSSLKLLSSSYGYLNEVMVCIWNVKDKQAQCIIDLINNLPSYTKFVIACFEYKESEVVEFLKTHKIEITEDRLLLVPSRNENFSVWIQDAFMVSCLKDQTIYIQNGGRQFLPSIKDLVNKKIGVRENGVYKLDGGDCLVGEKFLLIGAQTIYDNLQSSYKANLFLSTNDTYRIMHGIEIKQIHDLPVSHPYLDFLYELAGDKEIIIIGSLHYNEEVELTRSGTPVNVPVGVERGTNDIEYHLDVLITLTGCLTENGFEEILVAEYVDFDSGEPLMDDPANKSLAIEVEQLENKGFKVHRNPIPKFKNDRKIKISFNNCIVESTPTSKKVWVPTFKEDLESRYLELNKAIWKSLNFDIKELVDYSELYRERHGAARCMTKIINRKNYIMSNSFNLVKAPAKYDHNTGQFTIDNNGNTEILHLKEKAYEFSYEKSVTIHWSTADFNSSHAFVQFEAADMEFNCRAVGLVRSVDQQGGPREEVIGPVVYNDYFFGIGDLEHNDKVLAFQENKSVKLIVPTVSNNFISTKLSVKETAHSLSKILAPKLSGLSSDKPVFFKLENLSEITFFDKIQSGTPVASIDIHVPALNFQVQNLLVRTSDTESSTGETIVEGGPFLEAIIGAEDYRNLTGGYGVPLRPGFIYGVIQTDPSTISLKVWK